MFRGFWAEVGVRLLGSFDALSGGLGIKFVGHFGEGVEPVASFGVW